MNVVDLFKNYQVHILNAAKKSEKDYIKEVFSRTELFDISNLKETVPQLIPIERGEDLVAPLPKELSLPFDSCFIQIWSDEDEQLKDGDFEEYFADIEAQKNRDLEITNNDLEEEE
jgi:hypothetical protein